jgi:hypothetical protein
VGKDRFDSKNISMNIFVLDNDPRVAAQNLCDKHVVKMILESAQLLSTAHRYLDGTVSTKLGKGGRKYTTYIHPNPITDGFIYRSTMINHPCTIWTRHTTSNYDWLANHAIEMCHEYTSRYGKIHTSYNLLTWLQEKKPLGLPIGPLTPFAQAMPDIYKNTDAVEAYRAYYIGAKARFARWKNNKIPQWWVLTTTP